MAPGVNAVPWTRLFVALLLGLIAGSFLNGCIYRIPRNLSVFRPRSRCPHCGETIRWYDNIPILSYLFLGGRCRQCREPISVRYPLVEAVSAGVGLICGWWWLRGSADWFHFLLTGGIILVSLAIALIDFEFSIIPNELSYGLIATGLLAGFVPHYPIQYPSTEWISFSQVGYAAGGAVLGGGVFLGLALVSPLLYGKRALGMGDVKLLTGYGAWLGVKLTFLTLLLGSLLGALIGTTLMLVQGRHLREEIPFGPFLCAAAVVSLLYGDALIDWYITHLSVSGGA